jgi:hypothetical protein
VAICRRVDGNFGVPCLPAAANLNLGTTPLPGDGMNVALGKRNDNAGESGGNVELEDASIQHLIKFRGAVG